MNIFIVHAHNESQSFTSALKDQAIASFTAEGHEVQVSDLYAMNWNPVASADDFKQRNNEVYLVYALEQRNAFKTETLAADIQAEIEKVQWCDLLIFSFPMYWFSVPAILKGWIDRVMVSGLFYGGRRIYDKGGMQGKLALPVITLGGREGMFGAGSIHGDINDILKPLLQGTLGYCGFSVLQPFYGFHIPYLSDDERAAVLQSFQQRLGSLKDEPLLNFPSLSHFDDQLNPLNDGQRNS